MGAFRLLSLALVPIIAVALTASLENSTWDASTAGEVQAEEKVYERFNLYLQEFGNLINTGGHLFVGTAAIICNTLNIVVLGHQKTISPFVYLKWVAVCDLLTGVMMTWQGVMVNLDALRLYPALRVLSYRCQAIVYFIRSTLATSATYIICALGVDRLIAVLRPMKRAIWCTRRRAHITSAILCIAGIIPNFHLLFRVTLEYFPDSKTGLPLPFLTLTEIGRDKQILTITQWSKFLLKQILPLTVMVVTSTWTIVQILKSLRFRKQVNSQKSEKKIQCFGVTIGVIVLFIVTNAPLAFYIFDTSINGQDFTPSYSFSVFLLIAEFIPWSNSFLNFFVYILLNDTFRQDAIRLLLCRKKERHDYVTSTQLIGHQYQGNLG
ncbi:hypothetical protein CAPTEDRAFT_203673 [Capitella teleta]|uniref:G-protein coupled receptors family 1 profile domain-containing protein n=1 Tax=Capitella teleta TaxID=283909 RepID=R7TWY1_CAPTE|nr:hypothetical protein CAPTEDRAFT_203673 [Capitella teleta]|eukprot:ELT98413.1 hypothetical protein CAPTEDRAFT_203673 [Capitella teleta]